MRFLVYTIALLGGVNLACAQAQQHAFTVRDDIAMRRISYPLAEPSVSGSEIARPSPNGRFVAIVTTRGILATDLVESQIVVFDLRDVSNFLSTPTIPLPKARVIASVQSYPHHIEIDAYAPVIKDVRWSSDSTLVFFRAENVRGNYQLCTAGVNAAKLVYLSPPDRSVDQFDVIGRTVVLTAGDPATHLIDPGHALNRDAVDVTGARLQEILFPDDLASRAPALFHIYVLNMNRKGQPIRLVPHYSLLNIPVLSALYPFNASPSAQRLVDLEPAKALPEIWATYPPAPGAEQLRLTDTNDPRRLRADNILRPLEYTLIDLKTGEAKTLVPAPNARNLGYTADRNRIAWSPDGKQVVVTNTFLPVAFEDGDGADAHPCGAAVVNIDSLKPSCLYFEDGKNRSDSPRLQDIAYGKRANEINVLLRTGTGGQLIRTYTFRDRRWDLLSTAPVETSKNGLEGGVDDTLLPQDALKVFVHQSLNEPPTIWASDASGHERELWDPNPQLRQMQFGQAAMSQWKDKDGHAWSGILIKPVNYTPGMRYPLVIQLYSYNAGQFVTDGLYPTAFAARHLADAGFVVLQIKKQPDTLSEQDPQSHLEAYVSAIEKLSNDGLIDSKRVGVVGFSLTCWYAINALIKMPNLFAAATIADGLDNSYMQYMLFAVEFYPLQKQMDRVRGDSPVGNGLRQWIDVAPGFNLNRVRTPVRIEAIGPPAVLQEWELYSSLRLQKKPVDLVYFPSGTHIHQRPLERLESQQGNIDWLKFWLKDEEDSDPAKRAQYEQWEAMKTQKDR